MNLEHFYETIKNKNIFHKIGKDLYILLSNQSIYNCEEKLYLLFFEVVENKKGKILDLVHNFILGDQNSKKTLLKIIKTFIRHVNISTEDVCGYLIEKYEVSELDLNLIYFENEILSTYQENYQQALEANFEDLSLVRVDLRAFIQAKIASEDQACAHSVIRESIIRVQSYLIPPANRSPSLRYPRLLFENVLLVKGFRPPNIAAVDRRVLKACFQRLLQFSFAVSEKESDNISNKKKKNRLILHIQEETLCQTPILQEIYLSLSGLVGESHSPENFAFLFSPRHGEEQQPHLDYNYDPSRPISLVGASKSKKDTEKDSLPFFHRDMSFSFLYCLEDETMLHFISADDEAKITVYLSPGDLLIWSGQQVHYGGRYQNSSNLRLFGNLRAKNYPSYSNQFYWYDPRKVSVEQKPKKTKEDQRKRK